jgi:hypothetical protein
MTTKTSHEPLENYSYADKSAYILNLMDYVNKNTTGKRSKLTVECVYF